MKEVFIAAHRAVGDQLAAFVTWLASLLDMSPIDMMAVMCILFFPIARVGHNFIFRVGFPRIELIIVDMLRGAAFQPFLVIVAFGFSRSFMLANYTNYRVTIIVAGLIGLLVVLKAERWIVDYFRQFGP